MRSVTLLYQLSACSGRVEVRTWPLSFSIFWHCSSSFLLERWAFLGGRGGQRRLDSGVQALRIE
jgi:hypothetical protein